MTELTDADTAALADLTAEQLYALAALDEGQREQLANLVAAGAQPPSAEGTGTGSGGNLTEPMATTGGMEPAEMTVTSSSSENPDAQAAAAAAYEQGREPTTDELVSKQPGPDPALAEPAPEPLVDVTAVPPSTAQVRAAAAEANEGLLPGQTVTTTVAGDAVVTGTPNPESIEPVATLKDVGDYIGVESPLGRLVLGLEADAEGRIWVSCKVSSFNPDYVVEDDTILLRSRG